LEEAERGLDEDGEKNEKNVKKENTTMIYKATDKVDEKNVTMALEKERCKHRWKVESGELEESKRAKQ
jgi:hypothetical protein